MTSKQVEERALSDGSWRLIENVLSQVRDYAMFVLDTHGRILTWNDGAERIKGYTRDEIIGQHFSRFYPREVVESGFPERELEIVAHQGRFEDEGWRIRKDGSAFWASVVITALRDTTGQLRGFLKVTRDLTERRRNEQALRESEERFRLLIDNLFDYAIFLLDPDGLVESWNAGAERIKGYRASEIIGRHFSIFHIPEDVTARKAERLIQAALTQGRVDDESWCVRADGTRFWSRSVITRLLDAEGRLRGFASVTRDLSDQRRREELEEADRRNTEFLAMLSHELRNPLAPIHNAVSIMGEVELDNTRAAWARDVIERQTRHLGRLVDDLLDVSRITLGKIRIEQEDLELMSVVHRAVDQARPVIDALHHHLDIVAPDEGLRVTGDPTRLAQVIVNLLTNAAKYTPEGGRITLTVAAEEGAPVVRVRDTGVGITAEMRERIFDLFVQGERTLDRSAGGLGIGLTLSRRIVELHGGTLDAWSAGPGRGSEFIMRLPPPVAPGFAAAPETRAEGSLVPGQRVLVVDDHADAADSTAILLQLWGLDVQIAHDGEEALRLAERLKPDCVILDLGLPKLNGYEVASRVREIPDFGQTVMLVAITGYGQPEDRERTRTAGFDHHLTKPVDPNALRDLLLGSPEVTR